ncbi:citrate lyase holo-[acyl-carrier protein] synthase [Anaerosphaera multitolerans]|uniref:citrate lyase holo-[acyl-carrier protein] synthase n=1 Tax=Anaerosphaera multitolerans TaxID=2487351 RepID=A0A437S8K4_9FIRM|nr:citrate lyase holo-[acyl-carrier protein] synthase [Anaerosphaera multitolerans]RVU55271.1 citrate lyase holo-[acyl-carrier protein] synthase [Anaerosphaera multitolerans]
MDNYEVRMAEMLESKEERRKIQKEFIDKYKSTLISFMLNIPGEVKNKDSYVLFHKKYILEIKKILRKEKIELIDELYFNKKTGMEYYAVVNSNGENIKGLMVELEEKNESTRLLDIDVFDREFNQISRSEMGLSSRKCILCSKSAVQCMREENHSLEEIKAKVNKLILNEK